MADQRIAYTEEMVGSGHPTKADTLNRHALIEHSNEGTHKYKLAAKTAAYTVTADDNVITCDATTAAFTVTLPTAVGIQGKTYTIKKTDASINAITVDPAGTETIDGAATYVLSAQWKYVTIMSNNANWLITANN